MDSGRLSEQLIKEITQNNDMIHLIMLADSYYTGRDKELYSVAKNRILNLFKISSYDFVSPIRENQNLAPVLIAIVTRLSEAIANSTNKTDMELHQYLLNVISLVNQAMATQASSTTTADNSTSQLNPEKHVETRVESDEHIRHLQTAKGIIRVALNQFYLPDFTKSNALRAVTTLFSSVMTSNNPYSKTVDECNTTNALIKAVFDIELVLVKFIQEQISHFSNRDQFIQLMMRNRKLVEALKLIKTMNDALLILPTEMYLQEGNSVVNRVNHLLILQNPDSPPPGSIEYLTRIKKMIVLAMAKLSTVSEIEKQIDEIIKPIENKNHIIYLGVKKSANPGSMEVNSITVEHMAKMGSSIPGQAMSVSDAAAVAQPGAGAPSIINFPYWPQLDGHYELELSSAVIDTMNKLRMDFWCDEANDMVTLNSDNANERAANFIYGSFGFDKEAQLIYSPFFLDIFHELVHVYHNSTGQNAVSISSFKNETVIRGIWSNSEEYLTFKEQNKINVLLGLNEVFGHDGFFALAVIDPINGIATSDVWVRCLGDVEAQRDSTSPKMK